MIKQKILYNMYINVQVQWIKDSTFKSDCEMQDNMIPRNTCMIFDAKTN